MKILKKLMLLLSILCLSGCANITLGGVDYIFTNYDKYTKYEDVVTIAPPESGLKEVDIDWIAGEISLVSGDNVTIKETSTKGTYLPLYYYQDGSSLLIRFCASGTLYTKYKDTYKKLEVTIPSNLINLNLSNVSAKYSINTDNVNNLNISTVSGNGIVNLTSIDTFKYSSVSGRIDANIFNSNDTKLSTVSGDINIITNKTNELKCSSVSGKVDYVIKDTSDLNAIDLSTVSGSMTLVLDNTRGYSLDFSSLSGTNDLEFEDGEDTSLAKFNVKFSSVSGALIIKKFVA